MASDASGHSDETFARAGHESDGKETDHPLLIIKSKRRKFTSKKSKGRKRLTLGTIEHDKSFKERCDHTEPVEKVTGALTITALNGFLRNDTTHRQPKHQPNIV